MVSVAVPFQTYTAVWWQDRVLLTTSDGVWSWQPASRRSDVTPLQPGVIVALREGMLQLDPLAIVAGRLVRKRMTTGWRFDAATDRVTERDLSPAGQAWSEAPGTDASATTYPDADAVRLSAERGEVWLLWPRPCTAVWVGDSLVLNTANGEVIFFPGSFPCWSVSSPHD